MRRTLRLPGLVLWTNQRVINACTLFERAICLLQQIWDEVSFVSMMESCDGELEFLRQLSSALHVSVTCSALVTYLTRMKPSRSVVS